MPAATTDGEGVVVVVPSTRPDDMSHRLVGRVVSDLSHSSSRSSAADHGLHHRSTTGNSDDGGNNASKARRQKLSLLFSGVVAWTRSGETSSWAKDTKQQQQQQSASRGGAPRRRGLEMVLALRKYMAMLEQLFASYSGGGSSGRDGGDRRGERRRHTFTSGRRHHGAGDANAQSSSKRHRGRLSSAPASLRGSPASSGHLSVGDSVVTTKTSSTSSEVSTMEELQSAIQAAIAHCKNSAAAASDR